ncbi:MAG: ISChy9, transposase orfB [Dactylosporangium sp.]|nr:ISChy9, transposase orfB [Dactylosporangium sp.]
MLREGLRRLDLLRQSRAWRTARNLPAGALRRVRVRNAALNAARYALGLDENDLKAWARQARSASGWLADHVDAAVAEQLAGRAWKAVAGYLFGGKGRPAPAHRLAPTLRLPHRMPVP